MFIIFLISYVYIYLIHFLFKLFESSLNIIQYLLVAMLFFALSIVALRPIKGGLQPKYSPVDALRATLIIGAYPGHMPVIRRP